jgi:threonine synthase
MLGGRGPAVAASSAFGPIDIRCRYGARRTRLPPRRIAAESAQLFMPTAYLDPRTGQTFPLEQPRWCGPHHAPLLLTPLPGLTRTRIDNATRSLWRYRAAFPMQVDEPISMGEGCTPLIRRTLHGAPALLKCEWFMPTGSFKDRGASVMLSLLRAQGIRNVLEDSSGNGGAAVSAYAAAGGLDATIMAPASTSPAKTVQMRAHGANVELIPGTRQDTADAAIRRSETIFYASHNWHPFFLHGTKTLAYELWEDLGFRAPDNIVTPCGAGSNVLGCEIGFSELLSAGEIDSMPRIFAAQPANCGPIATAFLAGSDTPLDTEVLPTIAEGTAIAQPIRLTEVLGALRQTRGGAVMLSEAEIGGATLDLARIGIYVEPTSAQVAAAFAKLLAAGTITAEQTTVLVLTGSGLKATPRIAELLGVDYGSPPPLAGGDGGTG